MSDPVLTDIARGLGKLEGTVSQLVISMEQHRVDDVAAHATMIQKLDGFSADRSKVVGSWKTLVTLAAICSGIATALHWVAVNAVAYATAVPN